MMIEQQEPNADRVRVLHVRLPSKDWQTILIISEQLDLAVSEIARRAIRIGLSALNRSELPGGRKCDG
jgi:hypothetical protein